MLGSERVLAHRTIAWLDMDDIRAAYDLGIPENWEDVTSLLGNLRTVQWLGAFTFTAIPEKGIALACHL